MMKRTTQQAAYRLLSCRNARVASLTARCFQNFFMKGLFMLSWALTFLVIALVAAVLGFGGIAGTAAGIAKVLFLVFLVLFIVSLLFGRRGPAV